MKEELEIWRLILEGIVSLQEIEQSWSLDDVMRANALLDLKIDLRQEEERKASNGRGKGISH